MERAAWEKAKINNDFICIQAHLGTLGITPSNHEKLEAWSGVGISENDYVILSRDCEPREVAAGIKRVFDKCIE